MVIKKSSVEKRQSSFETPVCQDMNLGADEFDLVGKKGIRLCKEDFMCETLMNPLSRYD
jgi:hypothetical protein